MTYIYAGFLSYAHTDEAVAKRLHHALETYKIPKGQTGTLSPIFRDANELTAHHSLSEKIQGAVAGSKFLIVLCSTAAKSSHWVNEEIRLFRREHGEAAILCVLAEGTPETAFPPALLEGGREPLAANLGVTKTSFQLGVTQIAAAMLGVGLDTLIQRDARRKRRRLQAVTAGALVFSGLMGATTYSAVTARQAADTNRAQAEGLVEYMISDLKEKLEPVGRLDILDGIGLRAVEYYDAQDIKKLSDGSLARQARARHILGQVSLDAGDYDKARLETQAAARLTKEVYDRNPDDTDAIFSHAQSEYWVGSVYFLEKKYSQSLPYWENYASLGDMLYETDRSNFDWVMEKAWGANNIALLHLRMDKPEFVKSNYLKAETLFEEALVLAPKSKSVLEEIANVWSGLAQIALKEGDDSLALSYARKRIDLYQYHFDLNKSDYELRFSVIRSRANLLKFHSQQISEIEIEENILICLEEFDHLLFHDPNNERWKQYYKGLITFLDENRKIIRLAKLEEAIIDVRLKDLQSQ